MSNIILIGFMGCGKSCVGRRLSYRVKKTVIDTDKEIEKRKRKTIKEIFAHEGEEYFRHLETKCLKRLLRDKEEHVISVGGGLPMKEENRKLLKKMGFVVYLRVTPETVRERLKNDKTRPLLQGENPEAKIKALMRKRGPVYEKAADVIIDTDNKEFKKIVKEIQVAYHESLGNKRSQY